MPFPPGLDLFRPTPKRKRGAEPPIGGMERFYLNMLREYDPEYRQLAEELDGVVKRMQDYLDSNKENLMSAALHMAVPSSSRRRKRDGGGLFGGYIHSAIIKNLPDGVPWRVAAMWTIRAQREQPAAIARDTGWPAATVEEAITTFAQTIGSWKLLDKEGRLSS